MLKSATEILFCEIYSFNKFYGKLKICIILLYETKSKHKEDFIKFIQVKI